jgi:hypothetical protein
MSVPSKLQSYSQIICILRDIYFNFVGRDSSVGIATRYGLDGPGIETRRGEIFRSRPDRPWGPPSLLYNGYRVSFPGAKRPRRGVDNPPSSSARVKEGVELYLYSPFGPSWPVLGRPLPLILFILILCRPNCSGCLWVRLRELTEYPQEQQFPTLPLSRLTLGVTNSPTYWVPKIISWMLNCRSVEMTTDLYVAQKLRQCGALSSRSLYIVALPSRTLYVVCGALAR